MLAARAPSGHVFRVDRARGPVWYAKYRLPDGRQVQRKLGPAWSERGRPPAAYFTKRTAEAALRAILADARRGVLPGMVVTGATFADAAAEYLRYVEHDRGVKPSTLRDYESIIRAHLLPAFGEARLEDVTTSAIEQWRATVRSPKAGHSELSSRTKTKALVVLHGIFRRAQRVWGLPPNPVPDVERHSARATGDIEVFSVEQVHALVRAAADAQDGVIFLTAAFTGLRRGELIALRWRDVDLPGSVLRVRASYAGGQLTTPKSGKVRSVPLAPEVAQVLARLADRGFSTGDDDLVFEGEFGGYVDGSALRRRYAAAIKPAGLRPLRFHEYADVFVMPTSGRNVPQIGLIAA